MDHKHIAGFFSYLFSEVDKYKSASFIVLNIVYMNFMSIAASVITTYYEKQYFKEVSWCLKM